MKACRKRAYEEIPWDTVFEGSIVHCEKCLDLIKTIVLQDNVDIAMEIPVGKAPRLSYLDDNTNWSLKVAIEAKQLANDPLWSCKHPPEETYFVKAILKGVSNLLEEAKVFFIFFCGLSFRL